MRNNGVRAYKLLLEKFMIGSNLSEKRAKELIEIFVSSVIETLSAEEVNSLNIPGLGSFIFSEYQPRVRVLPYSKEKIVCPGGKKIRFKISKDVSNEILNK